MKVIFEELKKTSPRTGIPRYIGAHGGVSKKAGEYIYYCPDCCREIDTMGQEKCSCETIFQWETIEKMGLNEIEKYSYVYIKYQDTWWLAKVTGISKKTGWLTVWIGDYARLKVHYTQIRRKSYE